jgi:hypothetical protein
VSNINLKPKVMKKKVFTAQIEVAVVADNKIEATDAVSMLLSESFRFYPDGEMLDWKYIHWDKPVKMILDRGEIDLSEYEEGQIFRDS